MDKRLQDIDVTVVAVDGTLLKALSKMLWALWLDKDHRNAKIHLEFDVLEGVPLRSQVTDANANERTQLKSSLSSGKLYCLDAGYREYQLLDFIWRTKLNPIKRIVSYLLISLHIHQTANSETMLEEQSEKLYRVEN